MRAPSFNGVERRSFSLLFPVEKKNLLLLLLLLPLARELLITLLEVVPRRLRADALSRAVSLKEK